MWQPTKILRISEVLQTSTRPLRVETDEGPALAKYCGNRQGDIALCSELICAELMDQLQVDSPSYSVLDISSSDIARANVTIRGGPAFLTQWQERAITFSGSSNIFAQISNPDILSKLVVLDTWVKNSDRFDPDSVGDGENLDNLLFIPDGNRVRLMVIDFSHAFVETTFDDELGDDWPCDPILRGYLPTFDTLINERVVNDTLAAIMQFSVADLQSLMSDLPKAWGVRQSNIDLLAECLVERAEFLSEWLPSKVIKAPSLFLDGENNA